HLSYSDRRVLLPNRAHANSRSGPAIKMPAYLLPRRTMLCVLTRKYPIEWSGEQGRSGLGLAAHRFEIEQFGKRERFSVNSCLQYTSVRGLALGSLSKRFGGDQGKGRSRDGLYQTDSCCGLDAGIACVAQRLNSEGDPGLLERGLLHFHIQKYRTFPWLYPG